MVQPQVDNILQRIYYGYSELVHARTLDTIVLCLCTQDKMKTMKADYDKTIEEMQVKNPTQQCFSQTLFWTTCHLVSGTVCPCHFSDDVNVLVV